MRNCDVSERRPFRNWHMYIGLLVVPERRCVMRNCVVSERRPFCSWQYVLGLLSSQRDDVCGGGTPWGIF